MGIKKHKRSWLRGIYLAFIGATFTAILFCGSFLFYFSITLPNVEQLKEIKLQVPLKIYTADNKLIAEYGEKRRSPIALSQTPKLLIQAILDTEDKRFYSHSGVDFIGLIRAAKAVILSGKKIQGASTITMQVARNFFLTRKKTFTRKFKEILLAIKIDHDFSKDKILELYLNKIYLGQRSYGVAAAADTYYGKPLSELTLPQFAMIAGLPQAPSRDNPITNPKGALIRRNHVLKRMLEKGDITNTAYQQAISAPVTAKYHGQKITIQAPYVAEMVRQMILKKYGESAYKQGYSVYTTINSSLQNYANDSLQQGLLEYSGRHSYRGPEKNIGSNATEQDWRDLLDNIPNINNLVPAVVIKTKDGSIKAMFSNGNKIDVSITKPNFSWKFKVGDVIRVAQKNNKWLLTQVPKVSGALLALNPKNGAILALNGGFSFVSNKFNCAIQAARQAGSSFKPFIYSAALAKGFTLASIINDAPIVMSDNGENPLWRPQNVSRQFYGPTRLRIGLIESRNLVSIRLLQAIGIQYAISYLNNFGFKTNILPASLSLALGTALVSPLQLATGYAVFANGGYKVSPFLISKIKDRSDNLLYEHHQTLPQQAITPQNSYLITDVLKDVIRHGTGQQALILKRSDLAGKTGTTNEQKDAWFSGFNGDLVATVWIGFDTPKSLHEYGAQAALPIWINFMRQALQEQPQSNIAQPPGILTVRIDPITGLRAYPGQKNAIFETFREEYAPKGITQKPTANNQNSVVATEDELF